jgi:anthranilate phosphoribosyltransferase
MTDDLYTDALQAALAGTDLTEDQAYQLFSTLMAGQLSHARTAGLLIALAAKGPAVVELTGAARAMRDCAVPIDTGGADVVDIVGTGGTGVSTFNISTASCFVAAGAGANIAKHGNVTNTRASGAANALTALGVNIDIAPDVVTRCITEAGVGFCYARLCHPAMKHAAPVRKELPVRTIFNVLGPLTNPAGARRQVLGVFASQWTRPLAEVLQRLGVTDAWVVHGCGGLDELSILGPTEVTTLRRDALRDFTVNPLELGLSVGTLDDLAVTTPEASAEKIRAILTGQTGPARDIVLLNAAAALIVAELAGDLAEGIAKAAESIDSGAATACLDNLIAITTGS